MGWGLGFRLCCPVALGLELAVGFGQGGGRWREVRGVGLMADAARTTPHMPMQIGAADVGTQEP